MDDNEFLRDILAAITSELEKLNSFESEVLQRPSTTATDDLLESISVARKRLCGLAKSASSN